MSDTAIAASPPADDVSQDGRRQRSADSRKRIVTAMLDLVQAGSVAPGAEEVALRAGVGLRTVFRQFRDMEGLYREILESTRGDFVECFTTPLSPGTWGERLIETSERLCRVYDLRLPLRRAGLVRRYQSPSLNGGIVALTAALRDVLAAELPPDVARDTVRSARFLMILSFDSWMHLRDEQGLNARQASRVVRAGLDDLIASHA